MIVEKIKTSSINENVKNCISEILNESYLQSTYLIAEEYKKCDWIYLSYIDEDVVSFFMVGWHQLIIKNKIRNCVYCGLSATLNKYKHKGLVKYGYQAFIDDAIRFEITKNKDKLILWATTATPYSYTMALRLFDGVLPNFDGSYSTDYSEIATLIKQEFYPTALKSEYPFLLKGVAKKTQYSLEEKARIQKLIDIKKLSLFTNYNFNEEKGDRLLLIMQTPAIINS